MNQMLKHTYMHEFFGDVYPCEIKYLKNPPENAYQISVIIPIEYDTYEEAAACPAHLRFCKMHGHIVLAVFSNFEQGLNSSGKWFERVSGDVLEIIKWEEWWGYKISKSIGRFTDCPDVLTSFLPCAEKWDDIFQVERLPDGWGRNVQSLAYSVHCKVTPIEKT